MELDGTGHISYVKETVIYASGVAFNLLSLLLPRMGERFYLYSVGAAVFNLIPFAGSDGSGIVYNVAAMLASPTAAQRAQKVLERAFLAAAWLFSVFVNLYGEGSFALLIATVTLIVSSMR